MKFINSLSIFNVLLALDLITTHIGITYCGCVELNPLPFPIALTLRITLFLIFYYFKRDFVFHTFFVCVVLNNVLNILLPFNNIFLYVLAFYIFLNTFIFLKNYDGRQKSIRQRNNGFIRRLSNRAIRRKE